MLTPYQKRQKDEELMFDDVDERRKTKDERRKTKDERRRSKKNRRKLKNVFKTNVLVPNKYF